MARRTRTLTCAVAVVVLALQLGAGLAVRTQPKHELTEAARAVRDLENADPVLLFEKFQKDHSKVYENEAERVYRLGVFKTNLQTAKDLNARRIRDSDAYYGVTPFSDMTETELRSTRLMPTLGTESQAKMAEAPELDLTVSLSDVPDSWDWREHGAVTRVKNQGAVGTCWAFSAVGNIEGQYALSKGGELIDLSVEQVSDCDATMFPNNATGDCGVNGGEPFGAYDYIIRAGGIESDKDYPYCVGDFSCTPCAPDGMNVTICGHGIPGCSKEDSCHFDKSKAVTSLKGWASLAPGKNETILKAQLYQQGPVSIAIDARTLQFYVAGIVDPMFCSSNPNVADHAILVTGYGVQKDVFFQEVPYWHVKNSWGWAWGGNGYFKLRRGTNTCGMANFATTALV